MFDCSDKHYTFLRQDNNTSYNNLNVVRNTNGQNSISSDNVYVSCRQSTQTNTNQVFEPAIARVLRLRTSWHMHRMFEPDSTTMTKMKCELMNIYKHTLGVVSLHKPTRQILSSRKNTSYGSPRHHELCQVIGIYLNNPALNNVLWLSETSQMVCPSTVNYMDGGMVGCTCRL